MWIIKGRPRDLKFIKQLLSKKGHAVQDTQVEQFIFTVRDPSSDIPDTYRDRLEIKEFTEDWRRIAKEYDCIKHLVNAPREFDFDAHVKIISGKWEGLQGRVVRNSDMTCDVEIVVCGKLMKETFEHSALEVTESPFRG